MKFIPVAEETGLIVILGRRVLREACRQMREWQERYPGNPPLVVSVNVSARQFHSPRLVAEVDEILQETGLEPGCLALEITESVIQDDVEAAIETLEELRRLGVGLEIDDFGTGYSSFSYLKRFPVDTLKIDKSFVSGLGEGVEDAAIAQAIVSVAHTLGLKATAEGVETREQLEQLKEIGCDQVQGYFFSRPLDREAVASFMETGSLQLEKRA